MAAANKSAGQKQNQTDKDKTRAQTVSQSTMPAYSLEKSLLIPKAIVDSFGGKQGTPVQIALAIDWTPTSGPWRMLCGSSVAYGLTEGGYSANEIKLTNQGSAIVAPTDENVDKAALKEALLKPTLMGNFIRKYENQKFPAKEIGINVLNGMNLPRDRCGAAYDLIEENLKYVGGLRKTKTGFMVVLSDLPQSSSSGNGVVAAGDEEPQGQSERSLATISNGLAASGGVATIPSTVANTCVFISHGKSRELLEHLKKLVGFVKLKPVVSVETPDTTKPVPQKVLEEMRSCFGGIVHMRSEGEWTDTEGRTQMKINDNVLIEIGAAMAIYKSNFILLVERGVVLPSNLQGLFVCYYDGETMDGDATMNLLEGLNKFKPSN